MPHVMLRGLLTSVTRLTHRSPASRTANSLSEVRNFGTAPIAASRCCHSWWPSTASHGTSTSRSRPHSPLRSSCLRDSERPRKKHQSAEYRGGHEVILGCTAPDGDGPLKRISRALQVYPSWGHTRAIHVVCSSLPGVACSQTAG